MTATATFEWPLEASGCKFTVEELPEVDIRPTQDTSFDPVVSKSCVLVAHTPFLNTTRISLTYLSKYSNHLRIVDRNCHADYKQGNCRTVKSNIPIICEPGSTLFMYVKTSSSNPIVTSVRTGEFNAANVKLYGSCPPDINMPIG